MENFNYKNFNHILLILLKCFFLHRSISKNILTHFLNDLRHFQPYSTNLT